MQHGMASARLRAACKAYLKVVPRLLCHGCHQQRLEACGRKHIRHLANFVIKSHCCRCPAQQMLRVPLAVRSTRPFRLPGFRSNPPAASPFSQLLMGTRGSTPNPTRSVALAGCSASRSRRQAAGHAPPASSSSNMGAATERMLLQERRTADATVWILKLERRRSRAQCARRRRRRRQGASALGTFPQVPGPPASELSALTKLTKACGGGFSALTPRYSVALSSGASGGECCTRKIIYEP